MVDWDPILRFVREAKARYWIALALVAASILALPEPIASWLGLSLFRTGKWLGAVGAILLLSLAFSLVGIYTWVEGKVKESRKEEKVKEYLRTLTEGERTILRAALERSERTIYRDITNTYIRALTQKNILVPSEPPANGSIPTKRRGWPHMITESAWQHLKENPGLVEEES